MRKTLTALALTVVAGLDRPDSIVHPKNLRPVRGHDPDRFLGPEESMRIQAALGSDIALTFDECTPFHADRDYPARSTERTNRWLDRCLAWHEREGPPDQAVFGIVQGGVHEDLRR